MEKLLGCYLIVKNEEKDIAKCIENISNVCDEIVVVDTGSVDKTIEILKQYNNVQIEYFTWINDFSAARNYAMSKMKSKYVFSVDADEALSNKLITTLLKLKENDFYGYNSINMYIELDNNRFYLGGRQIVKNDPKNIWKYKVHEKLYYDESKDLVIDTYDGYVIHNPHDSKSHYNKYAEIYYNEINEGNFINDFNSAHYFYYLFFTLNSLDPFLARKYLYNIFILKNLKSNTENQGYNLYDCNWIDEENFIVNSLIGGYQTPVMVLKYYPKLKTEIGRYLCLYWSYENGANLSEEQYIDLAYISYQYGLFNDFIKITKELIVKYPNSEIGNHNINFINEKLNKLNEYNCIIDCGKGYDCLPSLVHFLSQYFETIYLTNYDEAKLNNINFNSIKKLIKLNDLNSIGNELKNFTITSDKQRKREEVKNIIETLIYK
jgi:glycosyltransferase involved in cell wall biosynthesis